MSSVSNGHVLPELYAAVTASLGGLAVGTVVSYSSPALPSIENVSKFGQISESEPSWIASLAPLAAAVATPFIGISLQWSGRKMMMFALTVPLLVGWLLITFANGVGMLFGGRILTGFAMGGYSLVCPVYINETASEEVRGRLSSIQPFAIHVGILCPFVIGTFLSYEWLSVSLCSVPILMVLMLLFVPESPRYLLTKGDFQKAKAALTWLRRGKSLTEIEEELNMMQKYLEVSNSEKVSWRGVFRDPGIMRPTGICLCLNFFQVASGIDAILFYNYQIFADSGSTFSPNLSSIIIGVVQVVAMGVAGFLMDRMGRKLLLILSEAVVSISLFLLGLSFYLMEVDEGMSSKIGWLPLASLVLFATGFSVGIGPIAWIYLEVIPTSVIGVMSGLAVATNWSAAFLDIKFFPSVSESIGAHWCFWIYAILSSIGFVYVIIFVPETKGKTLEELQEKFKENKKQNLQLTEQ